MLQINEFAVVDNPSPESIKKASQTSLWFLCEFILLSQVTIGTISYLIVDDADERYQFVETEIKGLPKVEKLTAELTLIGQYRGSCSTAQVSAEDSFEAQRFSDMCTTAGRELQSLGIEPPRLDSAPSVFFEQMTNLASDRISSIDDTFRSSNAILDPEAESYQLGVLLYRLYPALIESIGRVRGQSALVAAENLPRSTFERSLGQLEYNLLQYKQNAELFRPRSDSADLSIIKALSEYIQAVGKIEVRAALQSQSAGSVFQLFQKATRVIEQVKALSEKDLPRLLSLYNSRQQQIETTRNIWIGLLAGLYIISLIFSCKYFYFLRHLKSARIWEHQAVISLEQTLARQKEMFAVIGHELRTPVAAISMVGRDTETDAQTARDEIVSISENLLSVLEDMRVVVSPERALETKSLEDTDPVRIINRALSPLSQLLQQNAIKLRLRIGKPEGVVFSLHGQPLRQVVTNFVKNAAIHSGGTTVYVSFDYELAADGTAFAQLKVEDDGRGIPEHLRAKVFDSFTRGDTVRDGSGLGLFVAKEISALMQGTLVYTSREHGGACFTLKFPMKKAEVHEPIEAEQLSLEGLRILLAEDDAMLRMLTEKSLSKLGAEIVSYENGRKALSAYEAGQFDLVLTDLMMPEMDGYELTKSLRASDAQTPIIAVTAAVIGEETDSLLRAGANACISKPITPIKLKETLTSIGFTPNGAT